MTPESLIYKVVTSLISKSYLPKEYFLIGDEIISKASTLFIEDYARWYAGAMDINKIFTTPQLIAMLCYRLARALYCNTPPLKELSNSVESDLTMYAADAYSILGREIGQIEIYYSSEIGRGLRINHGVGTVIGARSRIGDNCTIHQNCTIGDRKGGRPTIGNNVIIYAGSMILGNTYIGDNSIIGANSVVTESCPANSVLVGTPARIIGNL